MPLAIFDLDETLIDCDSATLWLHHLVDQGHAPATMLDSEKAMMDDYRRGALSMQSYMDFTLTPLAGRTVAEVGQWADAFVNTLVPAHVYPQALQALAQHRHRGDQLLIISATADFIVRRVAAHLGVRHVMAIDLAEVGGRYTGQTEGTLTFREGKVVRLQAWLNAHGQNLEGSYGYSDSLNDVPLLRAVQNANVVNGGAPLCALAAQKQWNSLRWAMTDSDHSVRP